MTTLTIDAPRRPLWPVLLMALLLAVAVAASAHALAKHAEAAAVVEGCNRGPHSAWKAQGHANDVAYWLICRDDEGRYGVRKIRCGKKGWYGQTAFIPDASQLPYGSLQRAVEYVSARASLAQEDLTNACQ